MRSFKVFGSATVAALILVSSAAATSWDPQGVVRTGHGIMTLTSASFTATCTVHLNVKASGAFVTTTNAAGSAAGPTFSNCTNNTGVTPTVVTSSSAWTATATSTTAVDLTNINANINIGGGFCLMALSGAAVPNNAWGNGTHAFTFSSATAFTLTRTGTCLGSTTTGTLSGSIVFPSDVIIT